jgi:hypothetical protein
MRSPGLGYDLNKGMNETDVHGIVPKNASKNCQCEVPRRDDKQHPTLKLWQQRSIFIVHIEQNPSTP